MLAFGAAPAHAGEKTRSWADNPLLKPFEKVLAQRIEKAPDPFASRTKVIAFHIDAERKGSLPAPKDAAPAVPTQADPKKAEPRKAAAQPRPRRRLPRATPSFYVHYTADSVMRERGCRAGQHRAFGIVILAFGKPYYNGRSYGTLLFSGWFASNQEITRAMQTFARAYADCLPKGSKAHIALARGTSNYYTWIPSHYKAGWKWARETVLFARWLRKGG
jgi:hypothetical protein